MPFKFNPITGKLDLVNLSGGNSFTTIRTDTGTFPVADSSSDEVFIIGDGIFITVSGDSSIDTISINTLYTPENIANKATDFTTLNNDLYPTTLAVSNFVGSYLSGNNIFMLSSTNSDISGYESAVELSQYVADGLTTKNTTVTTSETLLEEFATNTGYPNTNAIPVGIVTFHYETEKVAGSNNYRTRAKLYKRDTGGTETLLLTSGYSTEVSFNVTIQQTVTALNASNIYLDPTDRLVCKIYAEMLSSSATIILIWEDNTDARFTIPTANGGSNSGDVSLTAIGSAPNANAATLTGQVLNLEPASASFGGVVTTTTQTFAGDKTFNGVIAHKLGTSLLPGIVPTGDTDSGIWSAGANSLSISTIATERIRIGVNNSGFINVHGNFTSQTYGLLLNGMAANVPTFGLRLANGQSSNLVDLVTYAGSVFGSITKYGYINFPVGSASTPTYSFIGSSSDCGMYSSGSDALNFSTAGTERLRFLSGGVINTGGNYTDTTAGFQMSALGTTTPILYLKHIASGTSDYLLCRDSSNTTKLNINYQGRVFADGGSAGAASYCFTNSSKSGMYHAGDETIAFATYTTERFSIDKEGNLRAYTLHNNATPNGNSQEQDIRSGSEYAATITNTNKIYDVALEKMQWLRVGNVVTVSGYGTASSIDAADYSFEISLPVASDFSDERQCAGVFMGYQNSLEPSNAIIKAETTNDTAYVSGFEPTGLTEVQIVVHFTYLVVSG